MIEFPHSKCITCRHLDKEWGVANDTNHRGSTTERVEAKKSCPYLGDRYHLLLRTIFQVCYNVSEPNYLPSGIHTIFSCELL